MRRLTGFVAVVVLLAAGNAAGQGVSVAGGLDEALRSLDAAVDALERGKGCRGKDRALQHLAVTRVRLVDALNSLGGVVRLGPGPGHPSVHVVVQDPVRPPPVVVAEPVPAGPGPMGAGRFQDLLRELKELTFSKAQLDYLRDASRHHWFVTDQVRQVVAGFTFGKDQVEAAALLYDRVLDRENFYQVQKELDFESDRDALRKRIRGMDHRGPPPGFED